MYQMRDTKTMFSQLDADKNGSLDRNELRQLCQMLGMDKLKDKHVDQLMEELDVDGDVSTVPPVLMPRSRYRIVFGTAACIVTAR